MQSKNIAYIAKLDHLRFLAAFLVIVYHYYHFQTGFYNGFKNPAVIAKSPGSALVIEGNVGVSLFLVLSGFIFSAIAYGRRISYGDFILNRLLRIMPLYGLAIFVASLLSGTTLAQLVSSLTFMTSIVPGVNDVRITPHLWTIAVEFQFYLIFPFLVGFLWRFGLKYAAGLILLLMIIRMLAWWPKDLPGVKALSYGTILGRLDQFLIGMVSGALYSGRGTQWNLDWLRHWSSPAIGVIVPVGTVWAFHRLGGGYFHLNPKHWFWIVWPIVEGASWALLILTYTMSSFDFPARLSRVLSYLGTLSFSLYVNHWLFVNNMPFHKWLPQMMQSYTGNAFLSVLLVVLPLLVAFSTLTFFVIERPFFELRKTYIRKDEPPASASHAGPG